MMISPRLLRRLSLGYTRSIFALACAIFAFTMTTPSLAQTLTIGTISATPVKETHAFQPFADYLAGRLAEDGIKTVKVVVAANIEDMAALLKSGGVDLFIDSSVTALAVNELSGSQYMLSRWKKGREKYRSVIFVRADSPIASLADMNGKVIAFEEPFSTSGFMLPALTMHRLGLKLNEVATVTSVPPVGSVGYVMAYDNETQLAWLERGRVQAAAMAEKDFKDFAKTALTPLRALYSTPYVPYHVMVHRADLGAGLVTRIKVVLTSAHETEPGRTVLQAFERTAKFDVIPAPLLTEVLSLQPYLHVITTPQ